MKSILDTKGLTLVEMLIVIAIIAILLSIAVIPFSNWMTKYTVESDIKTIYSDLMTARLRAMETNRMYFVQQAGNAYQVISDTDPAPFGDGSPATGADTIVLTRNISTPIITTLGLPALRFDSRGFAIDLPLTGANATAAVCANTNVSADYDCIVISQTRINMGKLTGGCNAVNCQIK